MLEDLTDSQIKSLGFAIAECLATDKTINELRRIHALVNVILCSLTASIALLTSPVSANTPLTSSAKTTEKIANKTTEKTTENATEKTTQKASEKAANKSSEKTADKKAEEPTEKIVEKTAEKVTEKKAEKKEESELFSPCKNC